MINGLMVTWLQCGVANHHIERMNCILGGYATRCGSIGSQTHHIVSTFGLDSLNGLLEFISVAWKPKLAEPVDVRLSWLH